MLIRTRHAAINITVDEPHAYTFLPYPEEEGWFWGEVSDEAGAALCMLGDFYEIPQAVEQGEGQPESNPVDSLESHLASEQPPDEQPTDGNLEEKLTVPEEGALSGQEVVPLPEQLGIIAEVVSSEQPPPVSTEQESGKKGRGKK